jgi:replicative DNA helicase
MGKTAFLLSIANNMAIKNNYTVAIFSAERSNQKMTNRIIESETGMSLDKLQHGSFKASEMDHMHSLLSSIAKANIFLMTPLHFLYKNWFNDAGN